MSALTWTRVDDGPDLGYASGDAAIYDNGNGLGPSKNSGRWAVEIAGKWIANVDTLAEAKARAISELIRAGKVCGTCADEGETNCNCWDQVES